MILCELVSPKLSDFTKTTIIESWCGIEGKYVNNPKDRGGETNFGITLTTATENKSELVAKFGWNGRMQDLTREMAFWIYEEKWWKKMRCDDLLAIHPFIADRVFDLAINGGRGLGVKTFQRILNACNRQGKDYADIVVDGGLGNASVSALNAYVAKRGQEGIDNFVFYQLAIQGEHYISLAEKDSSQEEFVNGWGSRVSKINRLYNRVLLGAK